MSLTTTHLHALRALVSARVGAAPVDAPDRSQWDGLLGAVDGELREVQSRRTGKKKATASGDGVAPAGNGGLTEADIGERVFVLDLPLQIEKPRKKPRILWAAPGEKPQPIRGRLASKLFGSAAKAKVAVKSWASLPAGATVPFKGGEIVADFTPVALVLAPTMNALRGMPTFSKQNARKEIAKRISEERARWPKAPWGGQHERVKHGTRERLSPVGGRRRFVRVTRFSARRPDDLGPDVIGAKLLLDQIVEAGILGDDSAAWCEREGRWEAAKTGAGFLRLEVHELHGEHGVPRPAAARKKKRPNATRAASD